MRILTLIVAIDLATALSGFCQYYEHSYFSVPITEELYTTKSVISNSQYNEYLKSIKKDSSVVFYESQIPQFNSNDSLITKENYFSKRDRRDYPTVYVDHHQAQAYCKWLDEVYRTSKPEKDTYIDKFKYDFSIRLPTIEEWTRMAIKYDYDLENTRELDEMEQVLVVPKKRFKRIAKNMGYSKSEIEKSWEDFNKFLLENKIYAIENLKYHGDNKFYDKLLSDNYPWILRMGYGMMDVPYDLSGNVSEMTQTKGVAKGGNWTTEAYEIGIYDFVKYSEPTNAIGFRCVCEIKER